VVIANTADKMNMEYRSMNCLQVRSVSKKKTECATVSVPEWPRIRI
jgi:hypothetical protein